MQDLDLVWKIAEECVKVSPFPISVKTRLGWDSNDQILSFAKGFDKRGVSAITIHGRTYKQGFSGKANWDPMYKVKEMVRMKVIGNGDIDSGKTALEKIGNLDGVMIGRHAFGNPWLLEETYLSLKNKKEEKLTVSFKEKIPVIQNHCKYLVELKGEKRAMLEIRKHLSSYVKSFEGAREIRNELVRVETLEEVTSILTPLL